MILDPTSDLVERAERRGHARRRPARPDSSAPATPPTSTDGVVISLQANIELPGDVLAARESGATGIGLYRSEFLLATIPADDAGEDAQCDAYRTLVEGMAPGQVTVRTFDVDDEQWRPWPRRG